MPRGIYVRTEKHCEILAKNSIFKEGNKVGFTDGHKPWHAGTKGIIKQGFQKGEKHWNWKGDDIGYGGRHMWIVEKLGKPMKCEHCGAEGLKPVNYHWANKDHKYRLDVLDWMRLCRSCHMKYDIKKGYRIYK